jgi:hypothetical protein
MASPSLFSDKTAQTSQSTTNASQQQQANQNTTQTATGTTTGSQSQNTATTGSQAQNVTSLDQGTQALLQSIIQGMGGTPGSLSTTLSGAITGAQPAIKAIQDLITGSPVSPAAAMKSAQDVASLQFDQGEGAQIGQGQQAIGSRNNSAAQLLAQKGMQDKATTVSGAVTNAGINAQNATANVGNTLSGLLSAISSGNLSGAGSMAEIANVLKGATTSGLTSTLGSASTVGQSLQTVLNNLIGNVNSTASGTSISNTTGNVNQTSTPSLFSDVVGLIGAL